MASEVVSASVARAEAESHSIRSAPEVIFVTRKPVFDAARTLHAYEITSDSPHGDGAGGTTHARQVIHNLLHVIGFDVAARDGGVHLPVTVENIVEEDHLMLPAGRTALVLGAPVQLSDAALARCRRARDEGYSIVADAARRGSAENTLLGIADTLRVDWRDVTSEQAAAVVRAARARKQVVLALNVDTAADFQAAVDAGCGLMQGFFFCAPATLSRRTLCGAESVLLRFLAEVNKPKIDLDAVENAVKCDVNLSTGLLKHLNSAAMGVRQRIKSIRHGLVLMGDRPLRKWASMVAVGAIASRKPRQLLVTSLVRANFCESLAPAVGAAERASDFFLVGLLAALDALLDVPMEQALEPLPITDDVRGTLLGDRESTLGRTLALAQASERGAWATAGALCARLQLTQRSAATEYYKALRVVDDALR